MATQHYVGSCHCGAVAFEADVDLDRTITCNCSRCQRLGAVLAFAPRAALAIKSGEDALTEYTFNRHKIRHFFCKTCGIEPFAFADAPDGSPGAAVNVNCLDGVNPRGLTSHAFDGRSL
jgi:hypothetical protein